MRLYLTSPDLLNTGAFNSQDFIQALADANYKAATHVTLRDGTALVMALFFNSLIPGSPGTTVSYYISRFTEASRLYAESHLGARAARGDVCYGREVGEIEDFIAACQGVKSASVPKEIWEPA